jgi:hypothetical protein
LQRRTVLEQEGESRNEPAKDDNGNNDNDNDEGSNGGNDGSNSGNENSSEEGSEEAKVDDSTNGTEAENTEGHGARHGKGSKYDQADELRLSTVRLELHLQISEKKLEEKFGLAEFNDALKSEMATAAGIEPGRLEILGVRGSFPDAPISLVEQDIKASLQDTPILAQIQQKSDGHSIVDIEVLPGSQPSDLSPKGVFAKLSEELANRKSRLRKSSLKEVLKDAELIKLDGVDGMWPGAASQLYRTSLLLPLAFSALLCMAL